MQARRGSSHAPHEGPPPNRRKAAKRAAGRRRQGPQDQADARAGSEIAPRGLFRPGARIGTGAIKENRSSWGGPRPEHVAAQLLAATAAQRVCDVETFSTYGSSPQTGAAACTRDVGVPEIRSNGSPGSHAALKFARATIDCIGG